LVEQRIENPRVGGSIPPQATTSFVLKERHSNALLFAPTLLRNAANPRLIDRALKAQVGIHVHVEVPTAGL
jgi:hypothetical protein